MFEFNDKGVGKGWEAGEVRQVKRHFGKTISVARVQRCVIECSNSFYVIRKMERTRNSWKCPLFGDLCDLKDNILPTYEDVMKFYEWIRHMLKFEKETKKEPTYKEIEAVVVEKLIQIWAKSSIPTVEPKRIIIEE